MAATAAADQALAAEIRAFVAAMPPVETTRDVLKRQLAARFAVPAQVLPQAVPSAKPQPAASPPASGQEKGADPAAPT